MFQGAMGHVKINKAVDQAGNAYNLYQVVQRHFKTHPGAENSSKCWRKRRTLFTF